MLIKIEDADVVETKEMVGMSMSLQNGVQPLDVIPENLLPEINGSVHHEHRALLLDGNGWPEANILRVIRATHRTRAINDRNPHRGPRT